MFYEQDHLLVTRKVTTNGRDLALHPETGMPLEKSFLAPMSALSHFEKRNQQLPANLKLKIEIIRVHSIKAPEPKMPKAVTKTPEQIQEEAAKKAPKVAPPADKLPAGVEAPPVLNF